VADVSHPLAGLVPKPAPEFKWVPVLAMMVAFYMRHALALVFKVGVIKVLPTALFAAVLVFWLAGFFEVKNFGPLRSTDSNLVQVAGKPIGIRFARPE
jgi:hypothetical protein